MAQQLLNLYADRPILTLASPVGWPHLPTQIIVRYPKPAFAARTAEPKEVEVSHAGHD